VRCNARGSQFDPGGLTTAYGNFCAGLDRVLFALTSCARVTIGECMDGVGRHRTRGGARCTLRRAGVPFGALSSWLRLDQPTRMTDIVCTDAVQRLTVMGRRNVCG